MDMASGATPIRARCSRTPTCRWWMSPSTRTGTRCSWQAWGSAGRSRGRPPRRRSRHRSTSAAGRSRSVCLSSELDDNGQFVFNVDASGLGVGGEFSPQNLTTDSTGRILVAGSDSDNPFEMVALDASGHRQWAQNVSPPSGSSNQWTPMVRVDPNADVFTAAAWLQQAADRGDTDDPLLYKFSPSGSPVWASPAAIPQGVWGPEAASSHVAKSLQDDVSLVLVRAPMTERAAPLDQPYEPSLVEPSWYDFWEKHGVFAASDAPADSRPVYVVPMPPPNVTGSLHMGHAQRCTLEDALTRWHRMRGFNTLWQPGMDHAGIATQLVVERQLAREGSSRHTLGREAFVERIWKWKAESGGRIATQQRELGGSPDWARSRFTMDPSMNRAVVEAFVRLYEQGLMYRATRLINWCPECMTSLSDLEVENEEGANGELFEFAYQVVGGDGTSPASPERGPHLTEIVVATTRPETMLGDTAVAVHPDDPRYATLHGKRVKHPFVDRTFPIVTDAVLVDPKFGTGAVKVTPAHDFNDFATGKRHKLEEINVFNLDGTMNANAGPFLGMDRKEARRAVKKGLADKGLARGTKPHVLTLPRCQRSGGVVEPMISTQWFLKMKAMAEKALDAVQSGRTVIIPSEWKKTYDHFLENIEIGRA